MASDVYEQVEGSRKAWLAMLGVVAVARKTMKKEVAPRYEALVEEGRMVENRMIRTTGDFIERRIAVGRDGLHVVQTTVEETIKGLRRRLRAGVKSGSRTAASVDALLHRIETLEASLRVQPRVRGA